MKKLVFLVCCLFVWMLSSCDYGSIHKNNFFIEGEFVGINSNDSNEEFHLFVTLISEKEFDDADGVNVVYDVYKKVFYSLELYYSDGGEDINLSFKNLVSYGSPLSYNDDFGNIITPLLNEHLINENLEENTYILNYKMNHDTYAFVYMKEKGKQI